MANRKNDSSNGNNGSENNGSGVVVDTVLATATVDGVRHDAVKLDTISIAVGEKMGDVAPAMTSTQTAAFKQAVADGDAIEQGFTDKPIEWIGECNADMDRLPEGLPHARRVYLFTKHQVFRHEAFGSCSTAAEFWRKSGMLARVMAGRNQTEAEAKVTLDNRWQYLKRTVRAEFETVKPKRDPIIPTAESILKTITAAVDKVPADDRWDVYLRVVSDLTDQYNRDVAAWQAATAKVNAEQMAAAGQVAA